MSLPPLVEPVAELSAAERARTARHASLLALGEIGQRRLAAAHVAVVGAGGLGSPVILALAAAGVGTLSVIDDDAVETSNLQRQVIHRHGDVGTRKVDSAVRAAGDLAPETRVVPLSRRLDPSNAAELLRDAHLVVDGTDTFETREAVAAACEQLGIPLVWGSVQAFDAQVTVFWSRPPEGVAAVRLADLYPPGSAGEVPTCAQVGVLGALCLQVGSLLATEAVKLIAGIGEPLLGRVLVIDGLRARQREVPLRSSDAPASAAPSTDTLSADPAAATPAPTAVSEAAGCRAPVARAPIAASATEPATVSAAALAAALDDGSAPALLDVREHHELATGVIAGSRHLPLADLLEAPDAVGEPVVVVCQGGVRARRATAAIVAAGGAATVLDGGMDAWRRTGLPVATLAANSTAAPAR